MRSKAASALGVKRDDETSLPPLQPRATNCTAVYVRRARDVLPTQQNTPCSVRMFRLQTASVDRRMHVSRRRIAKETFFFIVDDFLLACHLRLPDLPSRASRLVCVV